MESQAVFQAETEAKTFPIELSPRSPQELIAVIKIKMKNSSISPRTKSKVKEVVYFKKLKAIKQLVLLLDLGQEEIIDDPDNVPEDLRHHIFDDSDSVIEVRGHQRGRSSSDQRLRFDSSHMEFSGVFCMSCFHELYTQWKRDRGLLKGNLLSLILISSS